MLFVFNASLLLIDYWQPALTSKLAFLAARHCVVWLFIISIILLAISKCYAHVTNKYDDDDDDEKDRDKEIKQNTDILNW